MPISIADGIAMMERCKINRRKNVEQAGPSEPEFSKEVGKGGLQDAIDKMLASMRPLVWHKRARTDRPHTLPVGTLDFWGTATCAPHVPGVAWSMECKMKGEKPTEEQQADLMGWNVAGALTGVVYNVQQAKFIIEQAMSIARERKEAMDAVNAVWNKTNE